MSYFAFIIPALIAGLAGMSPGSAAPPAAVKKIVSGLPAAGGAETWLREQRSELAAIMRGHAGPAAAQIGDRLRLWRDAGAYVARTFGVTEQKQGYIIYPPQASLDLLLIDRMRAMCEEALRKNALPAVDDLLTMGGERLAPTPPWKYPSVARVRRALAPLSAVNLRGYKIFLLPFSLRDTSGLGGPGFAVLAAEPRDELLIPNQLEVTLVHEIGHYLHLAGMPRDTLAGLLRWRGYLKLRGMSWREDGRVKTSQWANSPEETFAEDFRLLFGGPAAAGDPPAAAAGDPRDDKILAARLRAFMAGLAAGTRPANAGSFWPAGDGDLPAGGRPGIGDSALALVAGILALTLIEAARRLECRRLRLKSA